MNYRVKNISQPHGADVSGAVIFSDNFTPPPPVKKSIITGEAEGKVILVGDALVAPPEELHVFGETLQKKTTGAQLFDKDTVTLDSYINDENGNVLPDSTKTICASDYISVSGLSNISVSGSSGNEWMAFYDNDKVFVSGKNEYGEAIFVPENAGYARFTVKKESLGTFMVNEGTTAKPYEPYTGGKPSPSPEYPQEIVSAGSVMTTGAQLFDISRVATNDYVVNNGDGSIDVVTGSDSTGVAAGGNNKLLDYCPGMEVGKVYTLTAKTTAQVVKQIYLRSSQSVWLFGTSKQVTEEDLDSAVYWYTDELNDIAVVSDIMVNEGSAPLPYEPYTGGKPAVNPEAGEIGVDVYGGNLFDYNQIKDIDSDYYDVDSEGYVIQKKGDGRSLSDIPILQKLESGSYAVKCFSDSGVNIQLVDRTNNIDLVRLYVSGRTEVFTLDFETDIGMKCYNATNNAKARIIISKTDYSGEWESYKQPQTITFNTPGGLPGIPVNSNGNYTDAEGQQWLSDSIEYKNEKLMYVQRVETLRLLTDVGSIDSQNGYLNINNFLNADITRRSGSLCTHLTYGDTRGDNVFWIDSSGTGVRIKISKYTTSEEYLSWLAENEVYLTYPCANPIEKEISDPNLINQLKSLRLNSPNTTIVNDANAFQKLKYLKETFTMANVNFRFGTYEQYKAVASKDTNTLYFVDGVIYKGDAPYSQKVEMVSAFPDTANAAQGILYVNSSTYEAKFFNGTDFTTVFVGTVGNMDDAGNDAKVVTQAAVKAYVTKQLADADIPTDGAIDEKINAAKEEAITEAVSQAGTAADQKDAALKTQLEQTMDTKIAAQVASVFRFKGSKANKGEIDAIEGMVTGDVWHSEDDGKEYVYDGEAWELLGFTVDLSAYATTAAVTQAINAKAEELTSAIATAKSEAIAAAKTETTTQVNAHAGDKTIHITGEERTAWNAKADTSYVDSAKQAAITAAASDATTKANQALTDAKAYTDQKNSAMDTRMKAVEAAVTWGEIA